MTTPTPQEIEVKAREWWITKSGRAYSDYDSLIPSDEVRIHAIEYSAYLKERERIQELEAENQVLKNCVGYLFEKDARIHTKIWGLTFDQMMKLKNYYELHSGKRAEDL
jgi:hypothetical protein